MKSFTGFIFALTLTSWAANVHAVPVSTIDNCSTLVLASCVFNFSGNTATQPLNGQKVLQLNYLFADNTNIYTMPILETPKSTDPIYNGLSSCIGTISNCNQWTIQFVFYGYIGKDGNTVTSVPEMLGGSYIWHGFRWGYTATCIAGNMTGGGCSAVDVHTNLTFNEVRAGERQNVPLPTTLVLLGTGIAGLSWSRRKKV